ncbi:MAG TPA: ATP synthase subunit I [Azospirillum sp.]|nr:ATP synthase subunit I [Azospirillum sp.]
MDTMMDTTILPHAVIGALAGAVLGAAFFRGLAATARLYADGEVKRALPLHLARVGGAAAAFTLAAWLGGAAALLSMLAGFQAARMVLVRPERRQP